jgi:hypothetical protein
MDVEWLTYDELADRLGIGRESARTLVKRKRWARKPGNDGRARIGLPLEDLAARRDQAGERSGEPVPGHVPERSGDQTEDRAGAVLAVLTRHIERLEGMLADARAQAADREAMQLERDAARADRDLATAQAQTERARREGLERRLEEAQERMAQRAAFEQQLAALQAQLAEMQAAAARPWWRRIVR